MAPQTGSDVNQWTYQTCLKDAKKYASEEEWKEKSPAAHEVAIKSHWIVEFRLYFKPKRMPKSKITRSKPKKKTTTHSPKQCLKLAQRCKTVTEWRNTHPQALKDAKVHGIYEKCIEHMNVRQYNQWSKEECLEHAQQYATRSEWSRGHAATYHYSKKMGWFNECVAHMPKPYETTKLDMTKEQCLAHAKKFKTRTEWSQGHTQSYRLARRMGWFNDCVAHMTTPKPRKQWTEEECVNIAKGYPDRKAWREGNLSSYSAAYQYGWMDKCTEHMPARASSKKIWKKSECAKYAKKFNSRTEWTKGHHGSYRAALENGWMDELMPAKNKTRNRILKKDCIADAKKFKSRTEWMRGASATYFRAKQKGWLDQLMPSMSSRWTEAACIESAKKYKTITEWMEHSRGAYAAAKRNNWFKKCTKHMKRASSPYKWNKEACIESASNVSNVQEWKKVENGAYLAARREGWLTECKKHMKKKSKS